MPLLRQEASWDHPLEFEGALCRFLGQLWGVSLGHLCRIFECFFGVIFGSPSGIDFGEIWDDLGCHFGAFLDALLGRT